MARSRQTAPLDGKIPKKIQGWGVCAWGWLQETGPGICVAKIPGGVAFSARPWRPAVLQTELLFQSCLLSSRTLAGRDDRAPVGRVLDGLVVVMVIRHASLLVGT
jgi:hypothetical protein